MAKATKKTQRKGRLTKAAAEKKKREGKRMYINGIPLAEIAEILEIYIDTVKSWRRAGDWDEAKNVHSISIGELKEQILQSFVDMKEGKTPKMSPDQLSKIAAAFEKLTDKKKNLAYMHDNYEALTDELIKRATQAKTKKDKDERLEMVKYVRVVMDAVVTQTYKEALYD